MSKGYTLLGALACAVLTAEPAMAKPDDIRFLNGVFVYEGDPGPIDPAKAPGATDPDMHLVIDNSGAALHFNTLYGEHNGAANCVFRQRVIVNDWDRNHPYVRVCRERG